MEFQWNLKMKFQWNINEIPLNFRYFIQLECRWDSSGIPAVFQKLFSVGICTNHEINWTLQTGGLKGRLGVGGGAGGARTSLQNIGLQLGQQGLKTSPKSSLSKPGIRGRKPGSRRTSVSISEQSVVF